MSIVLEVYMASVRARTDIQVGEKGTIAAEIVSFHELSDSKEHIALIFKGADKQDSPLIRMHSECLTGDVFNSSRCDCGDQLNETIEQMSINGGVLLYLRQEGRGIGLYNKLDAYELQSKGMNTYEANKHLGFGEDERDFTSAVEMLEALGVNSVKLITNNPKKIKALQLSALDVEQIVNTQVYEKPDNKAYLHAKQSHGGHNIELN